MDDRYPRPAEVAGLGSTPYGRVFSQCTCVVAPAFNVCISQSKKHNAECTENGTDEAACLQLQKHGCEWTGKAHTSSNCHPSRLTAGSSTTKDDSACAACNAGATAANNNEKCAAPTTAATTAPTTAR